MRKTLVYIVLLAILGLGVYYFLFNNGTDNPYGTSEAGFTIKDTAKIGRIFIADKHNNQVLLERTDSGWMVNKKYMALPAPVNTLLKTLAMQTPLAPVSKSAYNVVVKNMAGESYKTEIYDKDGKKMRVFYVGGAGPNSDATYMLMEGASTPYLVQVMGFKGYVTPRYSPFLREWRDRTIFNIGADQIKRVSVRYIDAPLNSFAISRDSKDSLVVDGDTNIVKHAPLNSRRAHLYLSYFTSTSAEGYITKDENTDTTIAANRLHCIIDITSTKGPYQHVDIYWMPLNKRSKNMVISSQDIPDDYDGDRFYAIINNKDTAIIQNYVFKKFFRSAYEFYEADAIPDTKQQQRPQPTNVMMHHDVPYTK